MNTNDYQAELSMYKLKTSRQKKRLQKEDFEKKLIQLNKYEASLYEQKRNLPMIPLQQPYQKGWKRFFVLRDDVKRCSKVNFYEQLLKKINTVQYSNDKNFTKRKKRKRKRVYAVKPQLLYEFPDYEWKSSSLKLTEAEKQHFHLKESWCNQQKKIIARYVYNEPWRFVLKIKPHMITEIKMVDEVLEQKISELNNYLERNYLRCKIDKVTDGCTWNIRSFSEEVKYKYRYKSKSLYEMLDEVKEEIEYIKINY